MLYMPGTRIDLRPITRSGSPDPAPQRQPLAFLPGTKILFLELPQRFLGVAFLPDRKYAAL
jgi:hypothetical protein